jgi:WD40 repeat protein
MAFFTPAGNKIKIWNALTGDIKRIYSDITVGEITAFALDNLAKRMIIGDSNGQTALFNVINGAKIKTLPKHTAEVTSICHAPDITAFFTGAMDNRVHMTLDNEFGESELLRRFILPDSVITIITFEPMTKLLLVGTNSG